MDILKRLFNKNTQPETQRPQIVDDATRKTIQHKVAGVAHYENNILSLARPNPLYTKSAKEIIKAKAYNQNIYMYSFLKCPVELVPEPLNPHDPNAIKVIIGEKHVGYIKAGSCKHILNLIKEHRIIKIDYEITGGDYINVWHDGADHKIEKGRLNYGIALFITESI